MALVRVQEEFCCRPRWKGIVVGRNCLGWRKKGLREHALYALLFSQWTRGCVCVDMYAYTFLPVHTHMYTSVLLSLFFSSDRCEALQVFLV